MFSPLQCGLSLTGETLGAIAPFKDKTGVTCNRLAIAESY